MNFNEQQFEINNLEVELLNLGETREFLEDLKYAYLDQYFLNNVYDISKSMDGYYSHLLLHKEIYRVEEK